MGRSLRIGLYSPYFGSTYGGGEKYLGTVAEVLRDAYPQHRVEIVSPVPADRERYERVLGLDLSGITLRSGTRRVTPVHRIVARAPGLRPLRNMMVARQAAAMTRDYDLWIAMAYVIPAISAARRSVMLCQFPYPLRDERMRHDLAGFDPIICQSEYVRRWVSGRWFRRSDVLHPPIEVPPHDPDLRRKRPLVLSVGRFVGSGHVKRHDVLLRAFRQLCDGGLLGWELVLAGSMHHDPASVAYHREIVELATGYPVRVLTDVPLDQLNRLYDEASIYWHAAGYGVNASADPAALEHFGMTTVEAMAHGAVPVVISRGGQTEIVTHGENGYLWETVDELTELSRLIIEHDALRRGLALAARAESRRFDRTHFDGKARNLLDPVVAALEPAAC